MEKWRGKIAVVTGASAGIGAETVKSLAKHGVNVIGLARRPERIEKMAKELGELPGKIHAYKCDVSDKESIRETFKCIEEKFKVIHIIVNNAGIGKKTQILTDNLDNSDELEEVINTNFSGLIRVTQHAYQLMKKSEDYGMIININSIAGYIIPFPKDGTSFANVYHGTKHAVTATTEVLRQELVCMNNNKIRVSSISPGVVETDFFHAASFIEKDMKIGDSLPALRSEDISNAIIFLLTTDYHVNITEMTVKPVGEPF